MRCLLIATLLAFTIGTGTASAAAPRIVIFSGAPLRHNVVISDWQKIFKVTEAVAGARAVPRRQLAGRPSFRVPVTTRSVIAPPAILASGQGWRVGRARIAAAGCPRCVQTESWASTVAYLDPPNQLPPHQTMAELGRADLIVHVTRSWEPSPPHWIFARHPLHINSSAIYANFEGNTTRGRVSRWLGSTWRNGSFVTVWVLFGSPTPTQGAVARAQHELDGARLPVWSIAR